jgi:hypothetical protein
MSFINQSIMQRLEQEQAEVFFVSGSATKWWNAQRQDKQHEIALLGGWYWTFNGQEHGPFRTSSGAWRDVYYRRVLEQMPPCMGKDELKRAERELKTNSEFNRKRRKQVPARAAALRIEGFSR